MTLNGVEVELVREQLVTTYDKDGKAYEYICVVVRDKPEVDPK